MTTTTFEQDTDNLFSWDMIISYFDDDGDLISKFIFNDDGTTRDETYFEGVLREVDIVDQETAAAPFGVESWQRQSESYDAFGNLEKTYRLDDNGIQTLGTYEYGVLRLKTEVDFAPNGLPEDAAIWETRYTYYNSQGMIDYRVETRDDGLEIVTHYDENGTRRAQEMYDLDPDTGGPSSNRTWDRIETNYDENGSIENRLRVDDDGALTWTTYENGTRRYEGKSDLDDFGQSTDARSWDSIESYFDENGLLSERIRVDDNGVVTFTSYDAGVRRYESKSDQDEYGNSTDAKPWDSIEAYYDETGTITQRFEQRDDGTTRFTEYENGIRRLDQYNDRDVMGNATDAKVWDTIEVRYDEEGVVDERFEVRDTGLTIYTDYENGVRAFQEQLDRDEFGFSTDTKSWDSLRRFYDSEGNLDATETVYDNTDITAYFYDAGVKTSRFDLDGDNSEDWYTREITYNPDGTIANTTYNIDPFDNPS